MGEDKAVLDLVGSNNGTIRVAISSGATNTPRIGIQIGRAVPAGTLLPGGNPDPAQSAVNMCLDRCTVRGYFKLSALMCVGAEVLEVRNGEYVNRYSGADTYSFILDGIHHWGLQSDYKTVTLPLDTPVGMTQTHIVQATFTRGGNNSVTGPAVWVARAHGSRWTKCYIGSWSDAPITIYSKDSGTRCIDLDIDAHIEHTSAPACFLFDGPDTSPTHTRLRYSEQYPQACTSSIFTASASMVKVTLAGFALSLPDTNITPTDGIFAPASKFTVTGDVYFGDTVAVDDPTNTVAFRGYRHVYNRLTHGYGPGSQWILDDTNTDLAFKGEFSVYGTAASGIAPGQIASTNRTRIQSHQIQMRPITGGGNVSWNAINPATGTQGASMTYRPADGAYTFGTTTECFSINNLGVMTHTLPPNERVQASHPTSPAPVKGTRYYNSTINKPLWFNGTAWTDAAGTVVP